MNNIGKRIKLLRKEEGISLQELSDFSGITKSYLWEIERRENSNPTIRVIVELCNYFCVSADYLIFGEKSNNDRKLKFAINNIKKIIESMEMHDD